MNDITAYFGEPISVYTRQQAIEDGVLIDASQMGTEAGFKWPVAITQAVYDRYVTVPPELEGLQDTTGRLWDILWMLKINIHASKLSQDCGIFRLLVSIPDEVELQSNEKVDLTTGLRLVTLKAVCGPGDKGEPVLTVMLPDED